MRFLLAIVISLAVPRPLPALAAVAPEPLKASIDTDDVAFPRPPTVRRQVRFWEKVFLKYPSTTVIIHDALEPDRIVDLIDYKAFATRDKLDEPAPRGEREQVTRKYLRRYARAVERFKKFGEKAAKFGAIETRVWNVYRSHPASLSRLLSGEVRIRGQTGLADEFNRAAGVAIAYLPRMEQIFSSLGVPTRLTRLPFVESMFNFKARSRVGASGIWQFMPSTARLFIHVNDLVDERNAPIKATKAAAQLLLGNFRDLQSWPLAITAYNHGRVGMQRAIKQVGSADIDVIIEKYQSPSFGFASRNFYSEFLAAADAFDRMQRQKVIKPTHTPPDSESIVLDVQLSVAQLVRHTPLSQQTIEAYNPCLRQTTYTTNAAKPLPKYYELHVPRNMFHATKAALIELRDKRYARR